MFDGIGAGSLLNTAAGFIGQHYQNEENKEAAEDQMEFQMMMSSTAYQRAVKDMQKAGLNPMLAYQQGGASTPGGAMPVIGNKVAAGMNSAATAAQVQNVSADTEKKEAEARNVDADTELKRTMIPLTMQQTLTSGSSAGHLEAMRDNIRQEMQLFPMKWRKTEWEARSAEHKEDVDRLHSYKARWEERDYAKLNVANEAAMLASKARLLGLEIPKAVNEAAAEASTFKKEVSPYLNDVGKLSGTGLRLNRMSQPFNRR